MNKWPSNVARKSRDLGSDVMMIVVEELARGYCLYPLVAIKTLCLTPSKAQVLPFSIFWGAITYQPNLYPARGKKNVSFHHPPPPPLPRSSAPYIPVVLQMVGWQRARSRKERGYSLEQILYCFRGVVPVIYIRVAGAERERRADGRREVVVERNGVEFWNIPV